MKCLVILESPNKIQKVSNYLKKIDCNNEYFVKASVGHFREIKDEGIFNIGIDPINLNVNWDISKEKIKVVKEIIDLAKNTDLVYIASDPDREGEVIAWHLSEVIKTFNKNMKRIRIKSITEKGVKEALDEIDDINQNYVNAGLTRTYIDKIFGYISSQILQVLNLGYSGGRVQSSILNILNKREIEIKNFVLKEWFIIKDKIAENFEITNIENLEDRETKKYNSYNEAYKNIPDFKKTYTIVEKEEKDFIDDPVLNFKTSSILKASSKHLKINVKTTEKILQKLFDEGYITYPRTDSEELEVSTQTAVEKYISEKFGQEKVGKFANKKNKNSQDGHPAITPTNVFLEPNELTKKNINLKQEEIKLYELIWTNTILSCFVLPKGKTQTYIFENNGLFFLGKKKTYNELGYLNIYEYKTIKSDNVFDLKDKALTKNNPTIYLKNNKPKQRFNEISLIEELEKLEIGRPSTYKTAVNVNFERQYVDLVDNKIMKINEKGEKVIAYLSKEFEEFIDLNFTKNFEKKLDEIHSGKEEYIAFIQKIYNELLKKGEKIMAVIEQKKCPKCAGGFLRRVKTKEGIDLGFESCSDYKKCDFNTKEKPDLENAPDCEGCENGKRIVVEYYDKETKTKKSFETCSNKCKWQKGAIQKCLICNEGWLVNKTKKDKTGTFIACNNYPLCKYIA